MAQQTLTTRPTSKLGPWQRLICLVAIGSLLWSPTIEATRRETAASDIQFETGMLEHRGVDPALAKYFSQKPRFQAGVQNVELILNGNRQGLLDMRFDEDGQLCFDQATLEGSQLRLPADYQQPTGTSLSSHTELCHDFLDAYPSAILEPRPSRNEVVLIVPGQALRTPELSLSGFTRGGTAGLLNYSTLFSQNQDARGASNFSAIDTELGLNWDDWLLRSRQSMVSQSGSRASRHLYAYAQKTFAPQKATLQLGQIYINSALFAGEAITGAQWAPEGSLIRGPKNGARVEGSAYSTARVEVRQNTALIYTTIVPAGPFTLTELPLLNSSTDLDVRIIEESGETRSFVVPAATLGAQAMSVVPGLAVALGTLRSQGPADNAVGLITATHSWSAGLDTQLTAGVMAADDYQSLGWGLNHRFSPDTSIAVRQLASSAQPHTTQGLKSTATLSTQLFPNVHSSFTASQQTRGYRNISEGRTAQGGGLLNDARQRHQLIASTSWTDADLGVFRLGYSYATAFEGTATRQVGGSWSRAFKKVQVSLDVEHNSGPSGAFQSGNAAYVSVTAPLGQRSIKTFASQAGKRTRFGASTSEQVNEYLGYNLRADRDATQRQTNLGVNLHLLPRYTQATLGFGRRDSDSSYYSATFKGGIAAHQGGVTASPYSISDTFGIVSVKDIGGVKINTPQGPVWTDSLGNAVASRLSDYQISRLEITPRSLPRNVDVRNAFKEVQAGRGSVSRIEFATLTSRRLLITARHPDSTPLKKGTLVVDAQDQYITTVVGDGQIYLTDATAQPLLDVQLDNGKRCRLDVQLAANPDLSAYFETLEAVCRPL